jgi:hypothetical protein
MEEQRARYDYCYYCQRFHLYNTGGATMRNRRGIASVVGMVFAIIALTTTIAYISYSMGILNNYNQSVLTKNQQLANVDEEKFQISSVTVPNGNLNITVANTGTLPIQFSKIWVQNTSATDWANSYVPVNNFVSVGGVLTNLGQKIPVTINPSYSYNVKLVTSRGNTQQFNLNSGGASPLNIQLMFLPPTVTDGFQSELMMVVLNNSTNTLTNLTPSSLPSPTYGSSNTGQLSCTAGPVSPAKYNTLAPGNVAIFTWAVTATNGNTGDTCTYNLTQPLQNGYVQSVSPASPLTTAAVSLSSTTYAQNAGVLTMSYTSFKWTQGGTWNTGWEIPADGKTTDFQITITNYNQTAGGYDLWLSKNTQMMLLNSNNSTGKSTSYPFFIVQCVTLTNGPGCDGGHTCTTAPCITPYADNSTGIPNQGTAPVTLYFGASYTGGGNQESQGGNFLVSGYDWYGSLVTYGKFTTTSTSSGTEYAQNMPFIGLITK